jgi:hypothetical protein
MEPQIMKNNSRRGHTGQAYPPNEEKSENLELGEKARATPERATHQGVQTRQGVLIQSKIRLRMDKLSITAWQTGRARAVLASARAFVSDKL